MSDFIQGTQHTHGPGYVLGSYWDGYVIVCGMCGDRIKNPCPTGGLSVPYTFKESPLKWLLGKRKPSTPTWPDWILGVRGQPWEGDPPDPEIERAKFLREYYR